MTYELPEYPWPAIDEKYFRETTTAAFLQNEAIRRTNEAFTEYQEKQENKSPNTPLQPLTFNVN